MKIEWLGHAAFVIEASDGRKLITDPYESGSYDGAVGYEEIDVAADVVTVSHDHPDHDGVEHLMKTPKHVVRTADKKEIAGFIICGFPTFHDETHGSERGPNTIYVIEAEGLRVCHMGDLGHDLTDEEISKLGRIDVLLIPVGGYFTIDDVQATQLIDRINPRIVVPMHFKTEVLGFPIAPLDDFISGKSNVVRLNSTCFEVHPDNLPDSTEIRILNYAK